MPPTETIMPQDFDYAEYFAQISVLGDLLRDRSERAWDLPALANLGRHCASAEVTRLPAEQFRAMMDEIMSELQPRIAELGLSPERAERFITAQFGGRGRKPERASVS